MKGTARLGDAWETRDEFFQLKPGKAKSLEEFLNRWGNWREPMIPQTRVCGLRGVPL